jgi:hypothetical protein
MQARRVVADRRWTRCWIAALGFALSFWFTAPAAQANETGYTWVVDRHVYSQVCTPEQSRALVGFLSNLRRDYRSVVVFDQQP